MKYRIVHITPHVYEIQFKFRWWPFWFEERWCGSKSEAIRDIKALKAANLHKVTVINEEDMGI